jgi:MFS family permease
MKPSYTWAVLVIHWLMWGFVGYDRFLPLYLFPVIVPELQLTQTQVGLIPAALALSWGVFATIGGSLSDRIGRKPVLIACTLLYSATSALTGFATNFASLFGIRLAAGVGEGAYYPAAAPVIFSVAQPKQRGLFFGLHHSGFAFWGALVGPILATQLVGPLGWRTVCFLTIIPGVLIAAAHYLVVREPRFEAHAPRPGTEHENPPWHHALRYHNIRVGSVLAIFMIGAFTMLATFMTLYLTTVRQLSLPDAGFVASASGLGGVLGYVVTPWLSDRFGRKPVTLIAILVAAVFLFAFLVAPTSAPLLFVLYLISGIGSFGAFPLFAALILVESVPENLRGAAGGLPLTGGEVIGGVLFPIVAGIAADTYGLAAPVLISATGAAIAFVIALFLKETNPRVLGVVELGPEAVAPAV